MSKNKIIIIGAGIVGSSIAHYLKERGINCDVTVLDSGGKLGGKLAGSKCSAGLWRNGWINDSIKRQVDASLPIVDMLFGIETTKMLNKNSEVEEEFYYVDRSKILLKSNDDRLVRRCEVISISDNKVKVKMGEEDEEILLEADKVILCAGHRTDEMLVKSGYSKNIFGLYKMWGMSYDLPEYEGGNIMNLWAPYRQACLFQRSNGWGYFGDGVTVKNPSDNDSRFDKVVPRVKTNAISTGMSKSEKVIKRIGIRPYLPKGVSFINRVDKNLLAITGGAKNTTVLSGYFAMEAFKFITDGKF